MCSKQNNYLKYPGQFTESKLWKDNQQSALQLYPRKRIWLDPGKSCFTVLVLQRSFWWDPWRGRADGGKFMETGVGRFCLLKWGPSSPGTKSNSWGQEPKRILGSFQKCFINKRKESWGQFRQSMGTHFCLINLVLLNLCLWKALFQLLGIQQQLTVCVYGFTLQTLLKIKLRRPEDRSALFMLNRNLIFTAPRPMTMCQTLGDESSVSKSRLTFFVTKRPVSKCALFLCCLCHKYSPLLRECKKSDKYYTENMA